jgi:hypothetical protein
LTLATSSNRQCWADGELLAGKEKILLLHRAVAEVVPEVGVRSEAYRLHAVPDSSHLSGGKSLATIE